MAAMKRSLSELALAPADSAAIEKRYLDSLQSQALAERLKALLG
jgi:hypothetical protein